MDVSVVSPALQEEMLAARERIKELERYEAEIICIRALLKLHGIHDTAASVRFLYDKGRAAFEKQRDAGTD
jgi:hypothetical protein